MKTFTEPSNNNSHLHASDVWRAILKRYEHIEKEALKFVLLKASMICFEEVLVKMNSTPPEVQIAATGIVYAITIETPNCGRQFIEFLDLLTRHLHVRELMQKFVMASSS